MSGKLTYTFFFDFVREHGAQFEVRREHHCLFDPEQWLQFAVLQYVTRLPSEAVHVSRAAVYLHRATHVISCLLYTSTLLSGSDKYFISVINHHNKYFIVIIQKLY